MKKIILCGFFASLMYYLPAQQTGNIIRETDEKINIYLEKAKDAKTNTETFPSGEQTLITFDNCAIIKVKHIENGLEKKVRWFFNNDTLFYSDKLWTKISINQVVDQEKCYLQKNSLQVWLNADGRPIDPNSEEFINLDKELPIYASNFLKRIHK